MINLDVNIFKLLGCITFKNVILLTCIIIADGKFYPEISLEEAFYDKYIQHKVYKCGILW